MQKTKRWHLQQCKKYLERIHVLPPNQGLQFLRLKKKAKKHLEAAKALELRGE